MPGRGASGTYPGELSTEEAKALIDTFPSVGNPIIIFTGGDPMIRPDVYELIAYAGSKGLRCVMSPNGTLITPENARKIKEAGVQRCSISIDATTPRNTMRSAVCPARSTHHARHRVSQGRGREFQINTTVTRDNLHDFKKIFELCERIGAAAWHIFLLVPMGRAAELADQVITAQEYEDVLHWFYDFRKTTPCTLRLPVRRTTTALCASAPARKASPYARHVRHGCHDARLSRRHGVLLHQHVGRFSRAGI